MKVNEVGYKNAKDLISEGKVDIKSGWEWTTADENRILGDGDWNEYKKWFLGVNEDANEETKARYSFPFGKDGKVFRSALVAIRQRAGQYKYKDIFEVAGELLDLINKDMEEEFEGEKWFTIFWNGKHKNKGLKKEWTVEDVEKIYEANKDRQIPIVIRHPEDDLPIIGFARGLRKKIENGKAILEAKLEKISKWVFDALKDKGFDKVSIALEGVMSGSPKIKHIGLVENPAIDGMPSVEFENEFLFSKEEYEMEVLEEMKQKLEQLQKENEALKEKIINFEREKREFLVKERVNELTRNLAPKQATKVEKLIREVFNVVNFEAFEKNELYQAVVEIIEELPKVEFRNNVSSVSEKENEQNIDKILESYVKMVKK